MLLMLVFLLPAASHGAEEASPGAAGDVREQDRYGMALEVANTYDPGHDRSFVLLSAVALYDYGKIWHQDRPKELCFKVEASLGGTTRPDLRTVASVGMLALYFFDRIATPQIRPYFEAGIGVIYTDFRVQGQGFRINFNPQLGIGAEFPQKSGKNLFMTFRLHHLSNAELHHDNRGVNSAALQVGRFF